MIVYKSQGQTLEDMDVVLITQSYGKVPYIVWYYMPTTSFILYPLTSSPFDKGLAETGRSSGHGIGKEHVGRLDDSDIEWEYLGNIFDAGCYSQLNIAGPHKTFKENLEFYLSNIQ